jgi:tRNA 2-thiocytidine biosynthesis protein TtcA
LFEDRFFQRIRKQVGRAIGDFGLIESGDRIAVAVSGGKDSYVLLHVLEALRRRAPVPFELIAVNIDPGFPGYRKDLLETHLQQHAFRYHLEQAGFSDIIDEKLRPGSSYCAFCARLRRGVLYTLADQLGCNKIALGHHLDDVIETLLLNQFYVGRLAAMSPRLLADNGRHIVIRPLVYVEEADIIEVAERNRLPVICCSCPVCGEMDQKRQAMKRLVDNLSREIPQVRQSLLKALGNVQPRHLLDLDLAILTAGIQEEAPCRT